MKEVKELSPKIKKVVELLKLETDYINAYDMFDKYIATLLHLPILF